jgi:hypothetical protein
VNSGRGSRCHREQSRGKPPVRRLASIWPLTHEARLVWPSGTSAVRPVSCKGNHYSNPTAGVKPSRDRAASSVSQRGSKREGNLERAGEARAIRGRAHGRTFGCSRWRAIAKGRRPGPVKPSSFERGGGGSGPGGPPKRDSRPVHGGSRQRTSEAGLRPRRAVENAAGEMGSVVSEGP